jgi:hypothetical protein
MVFHCYWNTAFVYVFAELFGATIAAALALPLYGSGQFGLLGLTAKQRFADQVPPAVSLPAASTKQRC